MRLVGWGLLALHAAWVADGGAPSDRQHAAATRETLPGLASTGHAPVDSGRRARLPRADGEREAGDEEAETGFRSPTAGRGESGRDGAPRRPASAAGGLKGRVGINLAEEPTERPRVAWQGEDQVSGVGCGWSGSECGDSSGGEGEGGGGGGGGGGGDRGGDGEGGGGDGSLLPQCYSSPAADPSEGVWVKCPGGEEACSPTRTTRGNWAGRWGTDFGRCTTLWATRHPGEGSRPYWTWRPAKCRLEEVSAAGFCRAMEGRKGLLLVGDSLTRQLALTLGAVLGAELVKTEKFASDLFVACGGDLRVRHYRNDLLDTRNQSFPTEHCVEPDYGSTRCTSFAGDSVLEEYDTLVVNSGAHVVEGGMSAYESTMSEAAATLTESMRRLHGDDAVLVVRNTSPGHWNCEPLIFNGPVDFETAVNLTAQAPALYQWDTFAEKNKVLEAAFEDAGGWTLMDIYSPTVLRADSHHGNGDCLHSCLPGPVDHWVTLLYNILLVESGSRR